MITVHIIRYLGTDTPRAARVLPYGVLGVFTQEVFSAFENLCQTEVKSGQRAMSQKKRENRCPIWSKWGKIPFMFAARTRPSNKLVKLALPSAFGEIRSHGLLSAQCPRLNINKSMVFFLLSFKI